METIIAVRGANNRVVTNPWARTSAPDLKPLANWDRADLRVWKHRLQDDPDLSQDAGLNHRVKMTFLPGFRPPLGSNKIG